ncbi:unnamed protein product [Heligmosomoides polygyrus]|uniref:BOS complex subunit TMEM147 n=1 Tax=Heligmosomoides polygyrus TaxID=6339 RepID=A0A183FLX3_HELPZ|nr:unnamed protein product [Heligmosomoides polygyrus]
MTFFHFNNCVALAYAPYFIMIKLLLLATVLPELLNSGADVVDVIEMHIVMTHLLNGKGEVRFLVGGLGWGAAHSVASSFILFWIGARASAFPWRWVQMALESSSDLFLFVAMAWAWMPAQAASRHLVLMLFTACVLHKSFYQVLFYVFHAKGSPMVVRSFVTYSNWSLWVLFGSWKHISEERLIASNLGDISKCYRCALLFVV